MKKEIKQQVPKEVEEESIDTIIKTVPLALDSKDKSIKKLGKFYLPFSTGFEIECERKPTFNEQDFLDIPNIIEVRVDSHEQRFRIPKGIKGLICLYNISIALKKNSLLNQGSGIHYHVNFNKYYDFLTDNEINANKEWILRELDSWNYKGTYNQRNVSRGRTAVKIHSSYRTLEFRIGEMTFSYWLLFKRIVHCNAIAQKLATSLIRSKYPHLTYQADDIIDVLKNREEPI